MPHANIWIRKEDWDKWRNTPNKAEFLHNALNRIPPSSLRSEWEIPDSSIKQPKKKNPSPAEGLNNFARACCLNKVKPCKHWQWDGAQMTYVNILTGEVREVDA